LPYGNFKTNLTKSYLKSSNEFFHNIKEVCIESKNPNLIEKLVNNREFKNIFNPFLHDFKIDLNQVKNFEKFIAISIYKKLVQLKKIKDVASI